jgi:arginine decarboxylase
VGVDKDPLISFGIALQDAGIGPFNLVKVSSIIPPRCSLIDKEQGLQLLSPGQILYCVLARKCTSTNELITAAVGAAIAANQTDVGCLYELTETGKSEAQTAKKAEKLTRELLHRSLGLQESRTLSIASEAMGKDSIFTTVVATAVFV